MTTDSKCQDSRQGAAESAQNEGKFSLASFGLHKRSELLRFIPDKSPLHVLAQAIDLANVREEVLTLDQLEMLEAELRNQSILPAIPEGIPTLAQDVLMEQNLLRWRAKRLGSGNRPIDFTINIHRYILALALDLLEIEQHGREDSAELSSTSRRSSLRAAYATDSAIAWKIAYLERIASYLAGTFDNPQNRYQQGLNLILRVIRTSSPHQHHTGRALCLPVSPQEFTSALKSN